MFGFNNIFGFFSGFTFRNLSYLHIDSGYEQKPSNNVTDGTSASQQSAQPQVIKPVEENSQPPDTIELSTPTAERPKIEEPVTYTPEIVAQNAPETPAPAEEQPSAEPVRVSSITDAKFKLNMIFNLTEFEQTLSAFAEDAEDGQVDLASYTDLNVGLHSNLKMNVRQKELYNVGEGAEGAPSELKYSEKGKLENMAAALLKNREFEAGLFYRESMKAKFRLSREYEDGFLEVSRRLSLKYTQDFRLNMRSLNLFNSQAPALDQSGQLGGYLDTTQALVDAPQTSGDLLNQFFETVQGYLDGAEDQLVDKINNFFDAMAGDMGLDSSMFDDARQTLVSSVESFFDRVDGAIGAVADKYLPPPEQPVPTEPVAAPAEPAPELGQEADAAVAA